MNQPQTDQQKPQALIKPGEYKAKVKDWGVKRNKDGSPRILVMFSLVEDGAQKNITWSGGISTDAQAKWTSDTLALLGMNTNDPSVLADGRKSKALNTEKDFEITIEHHTDQATQKTYNQVKWVNDPEERKFKDGLSATEAKTALAGFAGFLAEARQKRGPKNFAPNAQHSDPPALADAEIPF